MTSYYFHKSFPSCWRKCRQNLECRTMRGATL